MDEKDIKKGKNILKNKIKWLRKSLRCYYFFRFWQIVWNGALKAQHNSAQGNALCNKRIPPVAPCKGNLFQ